MIRKRKTIGSLYTRAKQLLPALAVAALGAASAQADIVQFESRKADGTVNGPVYSETSVTGLWQVSSVKSTAYAGSVAPGSRWISSHASALRTVVLKPTLGSAGGTYIVKITGPNTTASSNISVDVAATGGSMSVSSTTAFRFVSPNSWVTVGTLTLDPGVNTPTVTFSVPGGRAYNNRWYTHGFSFEEFNPCADIAAVSVSTASSNKAGDTIVNVAGVSATATSVKVYADGVMIGEKTADIAAGLNSVTTSALVKGATLSATQTIGGQEGCVPSAGPQVGGGANPSLFLAASVRKVSTNAGPVGVSGGGTGPLYFLGTSTGNLNDGPGSGVVINPNGCWQTVTIPAGAANAQYSGTTEALGSTGFVSFDGFAIKMNEADNGPFEIYIDDVRNGSDVLDDFEAHSVGQTRTFGTPHHSGSTSNYLYVGPNISAVTTDNSDSGNKSLRVSWQFLNILPATRWLRLTTDGQNPVSRPQIDLSQPITCRILVLPVGKTAADGQITAQPVGGQVVLGGSTSLSVTAEGVGNTYQWSKDGSPIANATDSSYSIAVAAHADAGDYTVEVVNATCSKTSTSAVASLLVVEAPAITAQPVSDTVPAGNTATFSVTATGGGLAYQWYYDVDGAGPEVAVALVNGGDISGATSASLSIANAAVADAGSYYVNVSNVAGALDSSVATLTVNDPGIVTHPLTQTVGEGTNVTFTVVAAGTPTLTYQWKKDGFAILDATDASYTITGATAANNGSYVVDVTNGNAATASSDPAILTVLTKPTITGQPASDSKQIGQTASFTVTASGSAPFTYQWKKDGADILNATDATYSFTVAADSGADYTVLVANAAGSELSAPATLTIVGPAFVITHPADATVGAGTNATFTVVAGGTEPISYQWELNGAPIGGATDASYTVLGATQATAGSYTVNVSNGLGGEESNGATLTVIDPPAVTGQPVDLTVDETQSASFSVTVSGTAPFTYQWKKDGDDIANATDATLNLSNVTLADAATYTVVVANFAGSVTSDGADLTVNAAPIITVHPASQAVVQGQTAGFSVTATGHPLNYQWRFNGEDISGATDSTLTVVDVQTVDLGYYSVVVSNPLGTVTSSDATLSVSGIAAMADNFDSYVDQAAFDAAWTPVSGKTAATLSTAEADSAPNSVLVDLTGSQRVERTFPELGAVSASKTVEFSFDFYDSNGGAASYRQHANLQDGLSPTGSGQLISMGLQNTPNSTFYMGRVLGHLAGAYFPLNDPGAPARSTGWHNLKVVISNTEFNFYVDGILAKTVPNTFTKRSYDNVRIGSGLSSTHIAYFDNVSVAASIAPTVVTTQPASQTVNAGTTATLSVAATGTGTLLYQWRKNGVNIPSANSASLVLNNVLAADAGSYTVIVTGDAGPVTSDAAVLTVTDPAINTQPVSQNVAVGANVTLSVGAAGTGTLTYQWAKGGLDIGGETSATLNLSGVSHLDSGSYTVTVTGDNGSITSDAAIIDVQDIPVIITQPIASQSVNEGVSASISVAVTGDEPLSYQWFKDDVAVLGATDATLTIPATDVTDSGTYKVTVENLVGSATSDPSTLTVIPDTLNPVLKVLAPKANGIYSNTTSLVVTGTVLDVVGVAGVNVTLNGGAVVPADVSFVANGKASNFTANVTMAPGTNNLVAVASDLAGNTHTVNVKFYYHTGSLLTFVQTLNGADPGATHVGTVIPNTIPLAMQAGSPSNLFVGRTYTLKVKETGLPKYVLTNWTATWDGQSSPVVVQTNNVICVFDMKPNMVLKANYIDNPFYRFGGAYNGLFSDSVNGVDFKSSGFAMLKVTDKQILSGKVFVDGNAIGFSGKLQIDGTGTIVTKARTKVTDKPELTINVTLDFLNGTETLSGTISDGSWTSDLLAHRATWSTNVGGTLATNFTNSYTFLMPGFADETVGPAGSSYQTVKLDSLGKVKSAGFSADKHVMKSSTVISKNGNWPYFSPQYKEPRINLLGKRIVETRGFVMGWLNFVTNSLGNMAPTGELHWVKQSWTNTTYTTGFTNSADIISSRWVAPIPKSGDRALNMTEATLSFSLGGLGANAFDATYFVSTNTTFVVIKGETTAETAANYPYTLKGSLAAKTGLIKGTFIHPDLPPLSKPTLWYGVMLQDQNDGAGFFMGPTLGGKVTATAKTLETPLP